MLDHNPYRFFVFDNLKSYSEDVAISGAKNPLKVILNGQNFLIHISDVHFANRNNADEFRIQLTPEEVLLHRQSITDGYQPIFLGLFLSGKAFVAWEPAYILASKAKKRFSVYCRNSQEKKVLSSGASIYTSRSQVLKRKIHTIALPAETLGFYLQNFGQFHQVAGESRVQSIITKSLESIEIPTVNVDTVLELENEGEREKFNYTRKAYPRDPKFKQYVLSAYDKTCCVCDRQLTLVQAAHIIPHSVDGSPNSVSNGLALCIEHHRLYDDALLLPGPERKLVFNEDRAEYLRQTKQEKGLDEIAAQDGQEFTVPNIKRHQPNDEYLQRGLEIRMGL